MEERKVKLEINGKDRFVSEHMVEDMLRFGAVLVKKKIKDPPKELLLPKEDLKENPKEIILPEMINTVKAKPKRKTPVRSKSTK